jgi:WD40 repeat protein
MCMDGEVRLWDVLSGGCLRELGGHTEAIFAYQLTQRLNQLQLVA